MKVLHFSTMDHLGGAFIAARRLHCALRKVESMQSKLCVSQKLNGTPDTTALDSLLAYKLRRRIDRLPLLVTGRDELTYQSLNWLPHSKVTRHLRRANPDVVHLHWLQNGFIPLSALPRFGKPLVWTFHDMWPLSGMRHNEFENPPRCLGDYDPSNRPSWLRGPDLDAWTWRRKRKVYEEIDVCGIVPSRWMADMAKASSLWREKRVEIIPNGIDTGLYKAADKWKARESFGLPQDKHVLLFGAMFANTDKNKGFRELVQALEILKARARPDLFLAVFGTDQCPEGVTMPFPSKFVGVVNDESRMATLYGAADIMAVPSLQESFGLTACEAISCGTPVACFDTSGLRDIVDHESCGYRARPFEPDDLARGIAWMLESGDRLEKLGIAGRKKVLEVFDLDVVANRHIELYRELATAK